MTMTTNTDRKAGQSYKLPIAIMFALFFMIAFVTGYQNPLGDVIKEMTGGSVLLTQLGTFANFIAYACMGLPAGKLLEAKGFRKTALWAVGVGFSGVLITYFSGWFSDNTTAVVVYILGAFVAGFSMCMLNTVVNPMLNSLGRTQAEGNKLLQFGGSCNSLGATLAPVVVGGLLGGEASTISSANPVFFLAMCIFAVAFVVIYLSKLPEAPDFGKKKDKISAAGAFRYSNFTFGAIAIFCYVGIEVGIANMAFQYLTNSELVQESNGLFQAAAIAGTVVGIYWLLMLVGRLTGGSLGDRFSSRAMLVFTSSLAAILLILGIYTPETVVPFIGFDSKHMLFSIVNVPLNSIFFIACGLCTSVMWGAIYNLSVQGLGKYTAVASGLFMTMVCGGGVLPLLQSAIASHSILSSFWLPAGLCLYLLAYALFLSHPSRSQKQEKEILYEDGTEAEV